MKFRDYSNYEVFEDGHIWSYKRNKFLKPATNQVGYKFVVLYDNECKRKTYRLNRLIYETFTSEPIPEGMEVNHIDENKENNHINNLNLMTHKENINFGSRTEKASKSLKNNKKLSKALTNNPKISKAVGAFKDGKLFMTFPSTSEAKRQGFSQGNIWACCIGKRKTHKGFEWRYI